MNALTIAQPTGIRAIGWGILGYIGGNLIINSIMAVFLMIIAEGGTDVWGLLAFPAIGLGVYAAYRFGTSREYEATTTGVNIAIALAVLAFIVGFLGAL